MKFCQVMKDLIYISILSVVFILFLAYPGVSYANWINSDRKTSSISENLISKNSNYSEQQDTLPVGVTKDWLNDLRDENGKRIITESNNGTSREIPENPEGDAFQSKSFNGTEANSNFGVSVSSAGDVNGDGYDDVIIGAHFQNSITGSAFIYFGGIVMNTIADVVLSGEATTNYFGYSVSGAGDVNGDGYDDVIVGAYGYSTSIGRAYIYYGGASMNNTADVTMTGEGINNNFGWSVSKAGDYNGDGYGDVIVGARRYSSFTGRAYIYYGGMSMNNSADVTMTGEGGSNYFGQSVSDAGDVNGDGFSDVIVGAHGYSSFTGRAYVYLGGSSPDNVADVIMTGETAVDRFGISVSSAGDVNGDGYNDIIIGAYKHSADFGKAYIYHGAGVTDNIADLTLTGISAATQFGYKVSSAGDINGDGFSDVIVGAPAYNSSTGQMYIFHGGVSMDSIAEDVLEGETTSGSFGISVSSAGDVNGDGYSDILSGAGGYNASTGRVYFYDYFMKNEIIPDLVMTGEADNNFYGKSVSSAGDVNGDGFSDIIVGAYGYSSITGRSYIYFGGLEMDNIADLTMTGELSFDYFGISVSSAGDVNGDGFSDVIIGADSYGPLDSGKAYIYFGGAVMDTIPDVIMTGKSDNVYFGNSVSSAGDVNGDGYSDVVVGEPGSSGYAGKAYIFLGGTLMDNIADVTMSGDSANNIFGSSVSDAGDVNGDSYADVIIGARGYLSNTGRAYIFFGGNIMDNVEDIVLIGESSGSRFGSSVSSAGDVNGDGYSDVISGAPYYNSNTGKTFLFFGGPIMNIIPDVVYEGETINNYFGYSVSKAGDINNDGYSDILIGAYYTSENGRAYIYLGSSSPDNIPDIWMSGDEPGGSFGNSVSDAGDVNGDGFADVLCGANQTNSATGSAFTFNGSAISSKPVLISAKDFPDDQGGKVDLKWAKSSNETYGINNITNYLIYRSRPPGTSGYEWAQIGDVTAVNLQFYYFTADTYSDSSSTSNGTTYFLIKSYNRNTGEILNSNIIFGRSIDNISPPLVSPFTAVSSGSDVRLDWKKSSAPDLLNYVIYRSADSSIDIYNDTIWTTATDSTLLDTTPLAGSYYYFIVAQDIHGNYSPVAVTQSPNNITVDLTMFIEGFYNAGTNIMVSDTITVQLRNSGSPFAVVDQTVDVVASDGTTQLSFSSAEAGNYYLAVFHRNSIETWSSSPIAVTSGGSVSYDLSAASAQAFGNNMIQIDGLPARYGIFSGDENQNGIVDLSDVVNVSNAAGSFTTGYVPSDMNGDNVVDLSDLVITSNNASAFVAAIVP